MSTPNPLENLLADALKHPGRQKIAVFHSLTIAATYECAGETVAVAVGRLNTMPTDDEMALVRCYLPRRYLGSKPLRPEIRHADIKGQWRINIYRCL